MIVAALLGMLLVGPNELGVRSMVVNSTSSSLSETTSSGSGLGLDANADCVNINAAPKLEPEPEVTTMLHVSDDDINTSSEEGETHADGDAVVASPVLISVGEHTHRNRNAHRGWHDVKHKHGGSKKQHHQGNKNTKKKKHMIPPPGVDGLDTETQVGHRHAPKEVSASQMSTQIQRLLRSVQSFQSAKLYDSDQNENQNQVYGNQLDATSSSSSKFSDTTEVENSLRNVFFAIITSPDHVKEREAMRSTWLPRVTERGASYKFFVGGLGMQHHRHTQLSAGKESSDVVLLPTGDGYYNLSRKTMGAAWWFEKQFLPDFNSNGRTSMHQQQQAELELQRYHDSELKNTNDEHERYVEAESIMLETATEIEAGSASASASAQGQGQGQGQRQSLEVAESIPLTRPAALRREAVHVKEGGASGSHSHSDNVRKQSENSRHHTRVKSKTSRVAQRQQQQQQQQQRRGRQHHSRSSSSSSSSSKHHHKSTTATTMHKRMHATTTTTTTTTTTHKDNNSQNSGSHSSNQKQKKQHSHESAAGEPGWIFVKIDDDVYLSTEAFSKLVASIKASQRKHKLYLGRLRHRAIVQRAKHHKWRVAESLYSNKHFPDYAEGPMYLLSQDATGYLAEAFDPNVKQDLVFPLEDVNTALVLKEHHIMPKSIADDDRFTLTRDPKLVSKHGFLLSHHEPSYWVWKPQYCPNSIVAVHAVGPERMMQVSESEEQRGAQSAIINEFCPEHKPENYTYIELHSDHIRRQR